ncbi:MAG TPA: 3D domain-containing protein [Kofleriaceae bacterium]|jgi:3D (Asp-Asp-Asp) domain-containing protein
MATALATRIEALGTAVVSTIESVATATRDSVASAINAVMARIVNGIGYMAIGLGLAACQQERPPEPVTAPPVQLPVPKAAPVVVDEGPKSLGDFTITFYYVATEDEVTAAAAERVEKKKKKLAAAAEAGTLFASTDAIPANDNEETSDPEQVTVYSQSCEPLAEVTRDFAEAMQLQGTGKLRDGRLLNIAGKCSCERSPCFHVVEAQWGLAGTGRALQPFRTVAVDPKVIKLGSLLYVPILEGRTMPGRAPWGGYVHDGCVVADDTGGGINDNQLDLFVGRRAYYLGVSGQGGSHSWAKHVPVFDGSKICERNGRKVARKAGAI